MKNSPKTTFVTWPNKDSAGLAFSVQSSPPCNRTEYTLTTHSNALVAAAYEDAAECCVEYAKGLVEDNGSYWMKTTLPEAIRDQIPANAQAAYDAAIAQARREGWEAGRSEAAGLADALSVEMEAYMAIPTTTTKSKALCIRNRIQALEYKEPET